MNGGLRDGATRMVRTDGGWTTALPLLCAADAAAVWIESGVTDTPTPHKRSPSSLCR